MTTSWTQNIDYPQNIESKSIPGGGLPYEKDGDARRLA